MRASDVEKQAIRDLCVNKRKLSNAERQAKLKRKRWTDQKKAAREQLSCAVPEGVAYQIGDAYLRREIYNRMAPIKREAVLESLREVSVPSGAEDFPKALCER